MPTRKKRAGPRVLGNGNRFYPLIRAGHGKSATVPSTRLASLRNPTPQTAATRDKSAARAVLLFFLCVSCFCYKNNEKEKWEPLSLVERQIYRIIVRTRSGYCDVSPFGLSESFFGFWILDPGHPVPCSLVGFQRRYQHRSLFFFLAFLFFLPSLSGSSRASPTYHPIAYLQLSFPQTASRGISATAEQREATPQSRALPFPACIQLSSSANAPSGEGKTSRCAFAASKLFQPKPAS